jgi:hypothetical protein
MPKLPLRYLLASTILLGGLSATSSALSAQTPVSTSAKSTILLGNGVVEPHQDSLPAGRPVAFSFRARAGGIAARVHVYVGNKNTANTILVGLYRNAHGRPGKLLGTGSIFSPRAGSWSTTQLNAGQVAPGETYWLTVLGVSGKLGYRDRQHGRCVSATTPVTGLRSLPHSWGAARLHNHLRCPISAYASTVIATTSPANTNPLAVSSVFGPLPSSTLGKSKAEASKPTSAPANSSPPIIKGTTSEGNVLASTNGTWTGAPTLYTYQWLDCNTAGERCSNVSGAQTSTHTLAATDLGHTMRVIVTATNAVGSTPADSAATAVVPDPKVIPPANSALPSITGTAKQGQVLTASKGTWSGSPTTYAYQWQDCDSKGNNCTNTSGATSATHTLTSADVGHTVRVVVTAANAGGSIPATSAATALVPVPPANSVVPAITGTITQGQVLTASKGTWTGSPTSYTYQWQDCDSTANNCTSISAATSTTHTLGSGDVEHRLRVVVTATNAGGSTSATSAATSEVPPAAVARPTNSALPSITGTTTEGQVLTTSKGTWTGSPTSYTYQWQDCDTSANNCTSISGATSITHTLTSTDVGHQLRAVVTAANAGGPTSATSAATATVAALPVTAPTNSALPSITGTTTQGQVLTTSKGTWTGSPTSYTYQWRDCDASGNNCTNISGASAATHTLTSTDVGHQLRAVVTAANAGGSTSATTAATGTVAAPSGGGGTAYPACTQTISQGANVASTVNSAAAASVICLNSGSYGSVTLNATHSGNVTLQAAPSAHATVSSMNISGSHVVLRGLWFGGEVTLQEGTSFITLDHNDITGGGEGVVLNTSDCTVPNAPKFSGCGPHEPITDVTMTGNHFHNIGENHTEDAIHLDNWRNIVITGNEFDHIIESGEHTDCLQSVYGGENLTFEHNYEHDNDCQGFFVKDGDVTNVTFSENLFLRDQEADAAGEKFGNLAQFWNIHELTMENNTIWDGKGLVLVAEGSSVSPTATVDHNLFSYFSVSKAVGTPYALTENHNIFENDPSSISRNSTDSVTANPGFDNTATDDYRLASNPNGIGIDWSPVGQQYGPNS